MSTTDTIVAQATPLVVAVSAFYVFQVVLPQRLHTPFWVNYLSHVMPIICRLKTWMAARWIKVSLSISPVQILSLAKMY